MAKKKSSVKQPRKRKAAQRKFAVKRTAKRVAAVKARKPKRAAPKRAARSRTGAPPRASERVKADLDAVFVELKSMLREYASALRVQADKAGTYYLNTLRDDLSGKPQFFGGARKGKNYVSLYLMPVYEFADLMSGMSADLRSRMQGKSCFNFATLAEIPREELKRLLDAAVARIKAAAPAIVPAAAS